MVIVTPIAARFVDALAGFMHGNKVPLRRSDQKFAGSFPLKNLGAVTEIQTSPMETQSNRVRHLNSTAGQAGKLWLYAFLG